MDAMQKAKALQQFPYNWPLKFGILMINRSNAKRITTTNKLWWTDWELNPDRPVMSRLHEPSCYRSIITLCITFSLC